MFKISDDHSLSILLLLVVSKWRIALLLDPSLIKAIAAFYSRCKA